jgi:hypothetical protein
MTKEQIDQQRMDIAFVSEQFCTQHANVSHLCLSKGSCRLSAHIWRSYCHQG